jgi:hypothetical protein
MAERQTINAVQNIGQADLPRIVPALLVVATLSNRIAPIRRGGALSAGKT